MLVNQMFVLSCESFNLVNHFHSGNHPLVIYIRRILAYRM